MKNPEFLAAQSEEIKPGTFVVARVKDRGKRDHYEPKEVEQVFAGTGEQASQLFGWGIARHLDSKGERVLLVFSKDDDIKFPKNVEDVK